MKSLIAAILIPPLMMASHAMAITVNQPEVQTSRFVIHSPDDWVKTLGEVSFIIDLQASHDTLFELSVRRAGLSLPDGRKITAFGYHKDEKIIIAAAGPVQHISVAGVEMADQGRASLVLFHDGQHQIIAPTPDDVAVYKIIDDSPLKTERLAFGYTPMKTASSINMVVDVMLDSSGSMDGFMPVVMQTTQNFLAALPEFTTCEVLTFNSHVSYLTPNDPLRKISCPDSGRYLNKDITAGGGTALFEALGTGLTTRLDSTSGKNVTKLIVAITDGRNTRQHDIFTQQKLLDLKSRQPVKTLVFWAGNYDPNELKGIADFEVVAGNDVQGELEAYFKSIQVSLSGLQTLTFQ